MATQASDHFTSSAMLITQALERVRQARRFVEQATVSLDTVPSLLPNGEEEDRALAQEIFQSMQQHVLMTAALLEESCNSLQEEQTVLNRLASQVRLRERSATRSEASKGTPDED